MVGSEKTFEQVLEAVKEAIDAQDGWTADKSVGNWTGDSLKNTVMDRTGLSSKTVGSLLRALESLSVLKQAPAPRSADPRLGFFAKLTRWTLLKPDAKIVRERGMFRIADKE